MGITARESGQIRSHVGIDEVLGVVQTGFDADGVPEPGEQEIEQQVDIAAVPGGSDFVDGPQQFLRFFDDHHFAQEFDGFFALLQNIIFNEIKGQFDVSQRQADDQGEMFRRTAMVFADEALLSVFENLLFNAFFHGKTEKVDIRINHVKDKCLISVIDYGIGIPDKYKSKIFEESFFYGETGQTGLGLFIVRQAIERYGGRIEVEDNIPSGTIFKFDLKEIK